MKSFPKLYKRTSTGKIQEWEIFVEGDKFWTVSGQQDGKKIIHAPTVCKAKSVGRANVTTPEDQAILEAKAKWKKQTDKHYKETIGAVDTKKYLSVMLAKDYYKRPTGKIDWDRAFISPKLDGIRFVAEKSRAYSRGGKSMGGGDVLHARITPLWEEYKDLITDGELYNHQYKDDFNTLVSLIKRDIKQIPDDIMENIMTHLQYHIYDVPVIGHHVDYEDRYHAFTDILNEHDSMHSLIKLVPYQRVRSHDEVLEVYENHIEQGYEGSINRFDLPYENKRTWNLLKVKEFMDAELKIVEVLEGVGKKAGTAGSITVQLPDGRTFNSNIKGGYVFYSQVWANREELIGKKATVQFFQYSEYGIPRFPYITKIDRDSYE